MNNAVRRLLATHPLLVTAPPEPGAAESCTRLVIGDSRDRELPLKFALWATNLGTRRTRRVVRIGGGCTGLSHDVRIKLAEYLVEGFQGYKGVLFSGGTREIGADGRTNPMVTDAAVAIRLANPHDTLLLGTFARTDGPFGLVGNSEFVVGNGNTRPNPAYDGILIVQNGPEGSLDWAGDLDACFGLVKKWCKDAGFRAGWVTANGGAVTEKEIMRSAHAGYPTILIRGFGRKTDEIADAIARGSSKGLPRRHKIMVVDRDDSRSLSDALMIAGLLD